MPYILGMQHCSSAWYPLLELRGASMKLREHIHALRDWNLDPAGTKCSRDEELLQQVLRGLGLKDKELSNLHEDDNVLVEW